MFGTIVRFSSIIVVRFSCISEFQFFLSVLICRLDWSTDNGQSKHNAGERGRGAKRFCCRRKSFGLEYKKNENNKRNATVLWYSGICILWNNERSCFAFDGHDIRLLSSFKIYFFVRCLAQYTAFSVLHYEFTYFLKTNFRNVFISCCFYFFLVLKTNTIRIDASFVGECQSVRVWLLLKY